MSSMRCRARLLAAALGPLVAAVLPAYADPAAAVAAGAPPTVRTGRGCYLVGRPVSLRGTGFAPMRGFVVSIDGVFFGQSITDPQGSFASSLLPGGLDSGVTQAIEQLGATDGTRTALRSFTLTRQAGARFLASRGDPRTLRAPFEAWGFALDGRRRPIYLHYVSPTGHATLTVTLGHSTGQCGYLRTPRRRVFPFLPTAGGWTLQLDTHRAYARKPRGPVARIGVQISG